MSITFSGSYLLINIGVYMRTFNIQCRWAVLDSQNKVVASFLTRPEAELFARNIEIIDSVYDSITV